ncbi:hypothetical protein GC167_06485 [bacterium]|nr:hypothetical protein [bacterium]
MIEASSPMMSDIRAFFATLDPVERSRFILDWSDDQPYLFGFLINLSDEFPEAVHEALFDAVLQLSETFRRTGLQVHPISEQVLTEVLEEAANLESVESSPMMINELQMSIEQVSGQSIDDPKMVEQIRIVLRTLIECFERSVPDPLP